ncbi:MAG: TetR/AcrR family transcriptional regulator [Gammaproteobacteria bacterium]
MKVSRAQAEENRRTVVDAAGRLFRKHGFDGIGLSDLMKAAGLTHGGFYKQFKSKDDLVVEACDSALARSAEKWAHVVESAGDDPFARLVSQYLSRGHRDGIDEGCAFAALGSDAARHNKALLGSFEAGIQSHLEILDRAMKASRSRGARNDSAVALSTMVGALLLSRVVEDEALSRRILDGAISSLVKRRRAPRRKPAR